MHILMKKLLFIQKVIQQFLILFLSQGHIARFSEVNF